MPPSAMHSCMHDLFFMPAFFAWPYDDEFCYFFPFLPNAKRKRQGCFFIFRSSRPLPFAPRLFEEGEEIRVENVHCSGCFVGIDHAGDVDFARACFAKKC